MHMMCNATSKMQGGRSKCAQSPGLCKRISRWSAEFLAAPPGALAAPVKVRSCYATTAVPSFGLGTAV